MNMDRVDQIWLGILSLRLLCTCGARVAHGSPNGTQSVELLISICNDLSSASLGISPQLFPPHLPPKCRSGRIDQYKTHIDRLLKLVSLSSRSASSLDDSIAYIRLGQIYEAIGKPKDALESYKKAVSATPDLIEARLRYAKAIRQDAIEQLGMDRVEKELREAINGRQYDSYKGSSLSEQLDLVNFNQKVATSTLVFFLYQEGRGDEALEILRGSFTHTLSRGILHYPAAPSVAVHGPFRNDVRFVQGVENALPDFMLEHMRESFSPGAPFWEEHDYTSATPYFSYVHPLRDRKKPNAALAFPTFQTRTKLDDIIEYLYNIAADLFPQAKAARYVEWWAHNRPHCDGHQLHFDSDHEGNALDASGAPRHPIVSSVLYLSEPVKGSVVGGPTLVTNQRLVDPLADRGYLVYPKLNRYVVFDGSVLHGVIPGRGPAASRDARRVTFMVAFWADIRTRPVVDGTPGSARPFPGPRVQYLSWNRKHHYSAGEEEKEFAENCRKALQQRCQCVPVMPLPVSSVWEQVSPSENGSENETFLSNDDVMWHEDFEEDIPLDYSGKTVLGPIPPYNECFQGF
ncbi:hypothetical protein BJ742DRAFT_771028 [Cladochytrium replicatum]|nr:hypothetical protein BJ742DRAFT_771028 [Cladochytrium replicatum]